MEREILLIAIYCKVESSARNTPEETWMLKKFRSVVETVNGHLAEHFSSTMPGGKSERGLLRVALQTGSTHPWCGAA